MLQAAIRRRNDTASRMDRERMQRRADAKAKHAVKLTKPASRLPKPDMVTVHTPEAA
jgi:hypothetical protein